jgi:hypothetical protein
VWFLLLLLLPKGLEVAGGSHRLADVQAVFKRVANRFAEDLDWVKSNEKRKSAKEDGASLGKAGSQGQGTDVPAGPMDYDLLPMALDVKEADERS